MPRRDADRATNDVRQPEPRQTFTLCVDEHGSPGIRGESALVEQITQNRGEIRGERHHTLLRPLSLDEYLARLLERKVSSTYAERFGSACTGAQEKQEQRVSGSPGSATRTSSASGA